ncbi:MAG: hypothetical protein WDO19_18240 [Bacteroidota bacterium]
MAAVLKNKTQKKKSRFQKAGAKPITVKGTTRTMGVRSFTFTPVSASTLRRNRNNAYRYFTID